MTAEVSKYIRKVQEITLTPESDLRDILLKDAIYNAAGISAFNLFDEVSDKGYVQDVKGLHKLNAQVAF